MHTKDKLAQALTEAGWCAVASSLPSRTPRTISRSFPRPSRGLEEWQAAVEALLLVVELNGPTMMMARIGMLRALNRHVERVFNPSRRIGESAS